MDKERFEGILPELNFEEEKEKGGKLRKENQR